MIDYDAMKIGDKERLPHPREWAGENREEYNRAQEYTTRTGKQFSVDFEKNAGGQLIGCTITRIR